MPIHEWSRVDPGLFHHFHQGWTVALADALNTGLLAPAYFALLQQVIAGSIPDYVQRSELDSYAQRANHISVRHRHGQVVALIEIVSPGNKNNGTALRAFVAKMVELLDQGIHLLVIDLLPPGPRDPQGIHKAIRDEVMEEPFEVPADKPLTLAAYEAGPVKVAYVEPVAVGDSLPDMPVFLAPGLHVVPPLETTYQTTCKVFPTVLKGLLEGPPPADT